MVEVRLVIAGPNGDLDRCRCPPNPRLLSGGVGIEVVDDESIGHYLSLDRGSIKPYGTATGQGQSQARDEAVVGQGVT